MSEKIVDATVNPADILERKKVLFYYILFFGSASMICIPLVFTAVVGLIVCILTVVGLYSTRSGAEEDGYLEAHMTYLIHTFWYSGLFMFYSVIAASLYLLGFASYLDFYSCIQTLPEIAVGAVKYGSVDGLMEAGGTCWRIFFLKNQMHLIISGIIAFVPIFIYLIYRYIKGWTLAVKHLIIKD